MTHLRTPRLLVGAALTTALAAGTLAFTAQAPASAQPATTAYVCIFPELDEVDVPLTIDVVNLPAELPVAIPVPADQWQAQASLRLDEITTAYLMSRSRTITASIKGLGLLLADKPIPLNVSSGPEALPVAEALDVPMLGSNTEFTPRFWADDLSLELPEVFTLDFADGAGVPLFSVECEWGDGDLGVIGTMDVVKQSATVSRKLVKRPVKATKRPKLLVTVVGQDGVGAPGEILASLGERNLVVIGLQDGRVTFKLPKLPVGKHKITLTYLGSKNVEKATRSMVVRVVEPPRH